MIYQQHFLVRKRINDELRYAFQFPLTIVTAAMGYGKTTAVREFLKSAGADAVWLSIERDESSAQYIWSMLMRQMCKVRPELGSRLLALGFPTDAAQRDKIKQIIEDHAYRSNTVMVIDDYHFAHSPLMDAFLESLVRSPVDGLHIFLLSRTVPDLSVDELCLKSYCYLIRHRYFEFTPEEIREYFRLYGFNLTDKTTRSVYDLSEGWVSAIYLIMRRYADIGRLESGGSIERLFETAVMPRYTEKEIALLKSLSLFDNFTPKQAVFITGEEAAAGILEDLSFANSFIRFDAQSGVYRIHNIFNDYLKKLIEKAPLDTAVDTLYERSGTWCIQNGDSLSGLSYYRKANRFDLILNEFSKTSITQIFDSNPDFVLDLFRAIPRHVKYRHPIAYIAYIGFYVTNVDIAEGEALLDEAEAHYNYDACVPAEMKTRIAGEIRLIRTYAAFNHVSRMYDGFKAAHALLGGQSRVANKDKIVTFGSPHILYLYHRDSGKLLQTVEYLEKLSPYYQELSGGCGMGFDEQFKAEYNLETGNLDRAEIFAYKAIYKASRTDQFSVIICAKLTLMRICAARGNFKAALEILDALSVEAEAVNAPILNSAVDLCAGYIQGLRGETAGFASWLKDGAINKSDILYQGIGFNDIVYGKYLLLTKEDIRLEVFIEDMRHSFSAFHNLFGMLHADLLDAACKYRLYGRAAALPSLVSALDLGRADNVLLPFAEYGEYLSDMLAALQKSACEDRYLNRVAQFSAQYAANVKRSGPEKNSLIRLSNREMQFLQLIADGKTNREIASSLFIAEVAVRKTMTSLYRKLDVAGRTTAVKKAVELKLI
ncbi:MAG: LuxR C-terminal-related transcriptional regulator [Oscillospiraceae bacterium]